MTRDEAHREETAYQTKRLAEAVEDLVEETRYQNAVLVELARATHGVAVASNDSSDPDERPERVPSSRGLQTWAEDHEFNRGGRESAGLRTDGGSDTQQKPTPPVPPTDFTEIREKRSETRTLESEVVDTCDCGGTIYDKTVATGRTLLAMWDGEFFDAEEYRLSEEVEQTEHRVCCEHCGELYTY